jgi:uncharacterized protein (DUF1778 family)
MTRTTISFTRAGMDLIREAAKRQGASVSQFVREAALMRAAMAADDNPYPMRALAAQLRAIGDQGYALADKALQVAEREAERKQRRLRSGVLP